jgi:hypothetical protein
VLRSADQSEFTDSGKKQYRVLRSADQSEFTDSGKKQYNGLQRTT